MVTRGCWLSQSLLRTCVVFESSLTANIQYDIQKLSQVLENVDSGLDIGEFIAAYSTSVHGMVDCVQRLSCASFRVFKNTD